MRHLVLFFLALLAVASHGAERLLLKNAIVHTVTSGVIDRGEVLLQDGKISDVGQNLSQESAAVIDLEGAHLYPGLFAAASSLGLLEIDAVRATRDFSEVGPFTPEVQSWIAVNPDSELLPVARANGITHFVPVPEGGTISGQSGVVALNGWTIEDMTIKKPAALHLFWPSMDLDPRPRDQVSDKSKWKSLEDQAKERRSRIKEINDFFEEAEAYFKGRKEGASFVPAWEAMLPVINREIPLIIHADELRQIKSVLQWNQTKNYRVILAGARDAWQVAPELARQNIPVIFDRIYSMRSKLAGTPAIDTDPYDVHFRAPAALHSAGVKLILSEGLGGDGASNLRNLPYTVAQAMAFGLSEDTALKAITLHPAEIFGLGNRLGSIEKGKEATLFTCSTDIFDIRGEVKRLWIVGKEVSLETRHTRLYEKYKNRPQP